MLTLALLALLGADAPLPPLPSPFYKAVVEARAIVEVEVPLEGGGRNAERWARGVAKAKVLRVVVSRAPDDAAPAKVPRWEVLRSCLARAGQRTSLRALLPVDAEGKLALFPLSTLGFGLEAVAGYDALERALVEASRWREERMRAVPASQLWAAQRAALASDNVFLRHLAAEWLVQHDAADVVDAAWGAPGTPERAEREKAASVMPDCR
ncbi:MAG: hypothetical protein ACOZQL_07730 [Myxococcota bacterium]